MQQRWLERVEVLRYAFQPIVNAHTGTCIGHEALLRNVEAAGFDSIHSLLDAAWSEGALYDLDLQLREKAFLAFMQAPFHENGLLFFNLDNRVTEVAGYTPGNTLRLLEEIGLPSEQICFEVSERHSFGSYANTRRLFNAYQRQGFKIALDDFGSEYAGLLLLYHAEPNYIKVSRFLIEGLESDPKKRLFVSSIVGLAHTLQSLVVAEGVETEREFLVCRDLGCELVQGYFLARPEVDTHILPQKFPLVADMRKGSSRASAGEDEAIRGLVELIPPILAKASVSEAFEAFQNHRDWAFLPVVNDGGEPAGVLRERDFKPYAYSAYGRDLLHNRACARSLEHFLVKCPVVEMDTSHERILEIYALAGGADGILMTETGRYAGFLSLSSLLKALNERNLQAARDQNPLTRLPGNTRIYRFLSEAIEDEDRGYLFVYYDLDNFKAFNDRFGFRQGDRIILLFADILREAAHGRDVFVGHIGGDDFFAGMSVSSGETFALLADVRHVMEKFDRNVTSFYPQQDRDRGFIRLPDRQGAERDFPLTTVSAGVLCLPAGPRALSLELLGEVIAGIKKEAKSNPERFAFQFLTAPQPPERPALLAGAASCGRDGGPE